jgi:hypothetical protein
MPIVLHFRETAQFQPASQLLRPGSSSFKTNWEDGEGDNASEQKGHLQLEAGEFSEKREAGG